MPEARFLASRIQDARRRGATNAEIADAFDINERTVRKIISGETPGTRVVARKMPKKPSKAPSPSIVRVDLNIGTDASGDPIVRSINARVPALRNRQGVAVAPTPFDVFRMPNLEAVAVAEGKRMQQRYMLPGMMSPSIQSIRPIGHRNPATKLYTVTTRVN